MIVKMDKIRNSLTELESILFRRWYISLIREKLSLTTNERINKIFKEKGISTIFLDNIELVKEYDFDSILIETAILYSHSMFDYLLNIISNELPGFSDLKKKDITYKNIKLHLKNEIVKNKLGELYEGKEFQYINAFCNISKHRTIIKKHIKIIDSEMKTGPEIDGIQYDSYSADKKTWREIYDLIEIFDANLVKVLKIVNDSIELI